MKTALKLKQIVTGTGLLCLALGCTAVTLGRVQGSAWIGSPLDLSVAVQFADGEEASAACVEADVFHADARQDASRIRIAVTPGTSPQTGNVRIASSAPVDEPVVTIYMRAGCLQKSTRRYVLLAELPNTAAAPSPAPYPALATASTNLAPPAPRVDNKAKPVSDQVQSPKPVKIAPQNPEPVPPPVERKAVKAAKAADTRLVSAPGKSRLKLDILDLMEERAPTLLSSTELTILPTDNLQLRSEATALWRAVNASPEDILREAAKVQMMAAEVDALKTLTAKNQQGLAELNARLQKAEAERYANWLVYVLVALLLAMAVALVRVWRRRVTPPEPVQWHAAP